MATVEQEAIQICPFAVLVDHREGLPYTFADLPAKKRWKGRLFVSCETTYLRTGDYTIAGYEDRFAIERKSLEDLYATLGQDRQRFEAELERLNEMEFAAVVIEATLREIWRPDVADWEWALLCLARYLPRKAGRLLARAQGWLERFFRREWRSKLNPRAVEGTMVSWSIRYPRVHWWCVGGRREGEVRTFEAMEQFWANDDKIDV